MYPVMKQYAANGTVVCAGSTSVVRYDHKDVVCFGAAFSTSPTATEEDNCVCDFFSFFDGTVAAI